MPSSAASRGLYGRGPGVALEDYRHRKLIVLGGQNPSATGIHLVPIIERAVADGARLIVVDPRRTPLARRAHLHLAVRPGTDLPVALAVIRELFASGRADEDFLAAHARGADELRRRADPWTIGRAAAEAGISDLDLERFIEMYTAMSPAVIRAGWGLERNRNGGSACAAVLALPAVAGKFGVRGGGFTMSNGDADWGVGPEPGINAAETTTRAINMVELGAALTEATPRVEVLFVYNCNPAQTVPDQNRVLRGLARDDLFTVVHEQVFTDTCRWADVVLPATAFLEHRDIRRGYGAMRMYDAPAVATPPGEARSNNQLFGALLERMGLWRDGDPMTDDELAQAIFAAGGEGGAELARQLRDKGVAVPARDRPLLFVDLPPATFDGKVDLVPAMLDAQTTDGMYHYQADPGNARFPLALISPAIAQQISSTFGQLRKIDAAAELSPGDAAARGITDGATIKIWNTLGEVVCKAKVTAHVRDGVVVLAKGLWRFHTRNGSASNALIPATLTDFAGGACYNDARVEVAAV
jgi:anaerobic selenocysteine-containing dehydrogenase